MAYKTSWITIFFFNVCLLFPINLYAADPLEPLLNEGHSDRSLSVGPEEDPDARTLLQGPVVEQQRSQEREDSSFSRVPNRKKKVKKRDRSSSLTSFSEMKKQSAKTEGLSRKPLTVSKAPLVIVDDTPLGAIAAEAKNFIFELNKEITALRLLKGKALSELESKTIWDGSEAFLKSLDNQFFMPLKPAVRNMGVLGGVVGCLPSSAASGLILYTTGYILGIQPSTASSTVAICWITISQAPAFMQQFSDRFINITTSLTCSDQFKPHSGEKDKSTADILKISPYFKRAIFANACLDGFIPAAALVYIYKDSYPLFLIFCGTPLVLSWVDHVYKIGIDWKSLNNIKFINPLDSDKRRALNRKLKHFVDSIDEEPLFAEKIFDFLSTFLASEQKERNYSGVSALFLKDFTDMEEHLGDADTTSGLLTTNHLRAQMGEDKVESFLRFISPVLQGAAIYGRITALESIISSILQHFSVDEATASTVGYSVASLQVALWTRLESHVQAKFMAGWRQRLSWNYFRTGAFIPALPSFVNGGLFALCRMVPAMQGYGGSSFSFIQKVSLATAFLTDLGLFNEFFSENYEKFISTALKTRPSCCKGEMPFIRKRAILRAHAYELSYLIRYRFDEETVSKIYSFILGGF